MGYLPSGRVRTLRPCLTTGIGYTGLVALGLVTICSKTITKGCIAIFVCCVAKDVHIEVVKSLSTEAFLAALRRFIARRWKPKTFYSDNGTVFQVASTQLQFYNILQCFMLHHKWQEYRIS